ncbi:hypothetical protein OROGR_014701 [Orobanche gracilis]
MPFPLQVVLNHELKGLISSRTWSKFASGQIATSIWFFNSRNFLTGDFSSSESFLFPLSIALNDINDQYIIDVRSLLVHFCKSSCMH